MIKFYSNRELSRNLDINLAKWKRWSREFLPPDPLGGMQSGYARQYNLDEAFQVYIGGHLVADLKFTIPEARQIHKDLRGWLEDNGFYFDSKGVAAINRGAEKLVKKCIIFILREQQLGSKNIYFYYTVRGIISNEKFHYKGFEVMKELYLETMIKSREEKISDSDVDIVNMLNITDVLNNFVTSLDLDRVHCPALSLNFS